MIKMCLARLIQWINGRLPTNADNWFTMPKSIIRVKRENCDVIGMIRITEKIHYQYQGKWQNVKSIYQKIKKSSDVKGIIGSAFVKLREDRP
ncbi:MAG TPA: hypothetical protein GXX43_06700 [Tepidanaerobacter syntrophicus]|uniref:hypothetical protein n=1 Tax=Tepidanaerobacter syntrophicus TaxID=224999 RepID=UPI001770B0F3|nr:hypothetical protein [Tepidanaerobacter syntrophicus]HHV83334.1 hypothetical protein [Tepidanaerobacter syntrophicus]